MNEKLYGPLKDYRDAAERLKKFAEKQGGEKELEDLNLLSDLIEFYKTTPTGHLKE